MPTYTFRCPLCLKKFRTDERGEPCCTGPSETRHEHELTVMRLVDVGRREVSPLYALARSRGPLLLGR